MLRKCFVWIQVIALWIIMVMALMACISALGVIKIYKPLAWFIVLVPYMILKKYEVKRRIEQKVERAIRKMQMKKEERMRKKKMDEEWEKELMKMKEEWMRKRMKNDEQVLR